MISISTKTKSTVISILFLLFFVFVFFFAPKLFISNLSSIAALADANSTIVSILSSLKEAVIAVDTQFALALTAICTVLVYLAAAKTKIPKSVCIISAVVIALFGFVLVTFSTKVNSIPFQVAFTSIISLLKSGMI